MWFLRGVPTKIKLRAVISSIPKGYQHCDVSFTVSADSQSNLHDGKMAVALSFPLAPNKSQGGLTVEYSTVHDLQIVEALKKLRNDANLQMMRVDELIGWHLDDIAVMVFWIEPEKEYFLRYKHKIGADSKLFFPTRLHSADKIPEMDWELTVIDGVLIDLPKQLIKNSAFTSPGCLTFKKWAWDEDTRISSNNWESSDDEMSDDD